MSATRLLAQKWEMVDTASLHDKRDIRFAVLDQSTSGFCQQPVQLVGKLLLVLVVQWRRTP